MLVVLLVLDKIAGRIDDEDKDDDEPHLGRVNLEK